jgi:hypothetical protein
VAKVPLIIPAQFAQNIFFFQATLDICCELAMPTLAVGREKATLQIQENLGTSVPHRNHWGDTFQGSCLPPPLPIKDIWAGRLHSRVNVISGPFLVK